MLLTWGSRVAETSRIEVFAKQAQHDDSKFHQGHVLQLPVVEEEGVWWTSTTASLVPTEDAHVPVTRIWSIRKHSC